MQEIRIEPAVFTLASEFASSDKGRININVVHFDATEKKAVATDGRALAHIDHETPAESLSVPVDALKAAQKAATARGAVVLRVADDGAASLVAIMPTGGEASFPIRPDDAGEFPKWRQVAPASLPRVESGSATFQAFDPFLVVRFARLANVLAGEKATAMQSGVLVHSREPLGAALVTDGTGERRLGVVMPMRTAYADAIHERERAEREARAIRGEHAA